MKPKKQFDPHDHPMGHLHEPPKYTPEQVKAILDATDWDEYWRDVNEWVAPQIDALREARRKSYEIACGGTVFD